jgi:sugar O-acyltransferase (sialic acid O-acetyltransferase NeuD family)
MLIVGAKGFAKEVLEVLCQLNQTGNVVFYDDVNQDVPDLLFEKFPILKTIDQASEYLHTIDKRFNIGIGNPKLRKLMYQKFIALGGEFTTLISPFAQLGHYGNLINVGCNIMTGAVITNDIKIGKGGLINLNCTVGHDSVIGEFVEMSPGVHISGNCFIGDYCNLGTNSTVLPGLEIGTNVIVGAGAVITTNIPSNSLVVGVPGRIIKELQPLNF